MPPCPGRRPGSPPAVAPASQTDPASSRGTVPRREALCLVSAPIGPPAPLLPVSRGLRADRLTVSGNHTSRVFKVEAGEDVRLSGLTIAGGNAGTGFGGGIDNFGALTVSNVVFSGNAAAAGGGLANQSGGTATVRGSTF